MATDWKHAARAHGVEATEPQLDAYAQTLSILEGQMAILKKELPSEVEPATVFQPIREAGARQ